MKSAAHSMKSPVITNPEIPIRAEQTKVETAIAKSWLKIAPGWPLRNLIAVNPLAGLEDLTFEKALGSGKAYFQQKDLPLHMQQINRQLIKWLQVFFDDGQATIRMPNREKGLLKAVRHLIKFDRSLYPKDPEKEKWFIQLPEAPQSLICECLCYLEIPAGNYEVFLTLVLTTLPGWAAYVQYRSSWPDARDRQHPHPVTKEDYLALRLIITCLLWPEAKELLDWYEQALKNTNTETLIGNIEKSEAFYRGKLLAELAEQKISLPVTPAAQLIFCIDVRSEPFRRAIEQQGSYDTYGFAGFFGIPVSIENKVTGESHASCPVLLKPAYHIKEFPVGDLVSCQAAHLKMTGFKKLYQSVKNTFLTPFALVETLGFGSGIWMLFRSLAPDLSHLLKSGIVNAIEPPYGLVPFIDNIPVDKQSSYAISALRMIGLTEGFAPLVVLCGHGSETQNNAYATALDCGACGGRHGAPNARILSAILNSSNIRLLLKEQGITIPDSTCFIAAEHNTTTDHVQLYPDGVPDSHRKGIETLKADLDKAREYAGHRRYRTIGKSNSSRQSSKKTALRAHDWAQVRPEWGLARNAAFIIGPRGWTKNLHLDGRCFLHSYEWKLDPGGASLAAILTAPMVVAQWINSQYLFSTIDNVAYGGGSKITKNITGKIGIMQGNASDLMYGLPMQSVYKTDTEPYHQPVRLMPVINAPRHLIDPIIAEKDILKKLVGNGWVTLACIEPDTQETFLLTRNFQWEKNK